MATHQPNTGEYFKIALNTAPVMVPEKTFVPALIEVAERDLYLALSIVVQALKSLERLHEYHVVHGSIRPDRINILSADGRQIVELTGFDFAPQHEFLSRRNPTGEVSADLNYASPEQIFGYPLDLRSDIYSIGCVLFELVTGRSPFVAACADESLARRFELTTEDLESALNGAYRPSKLSTTIARCLATDPDARYQSVTELRDELLVVLYPKTEEFFNDLQQRQIPWCRQFFNETVQILFGSSLGACFIVAISVAAFAFVCLMYGMLRL